MKTEHLKTNLLLRPERPKVLVIILFLLFPIFSYGGNSRMSENRETFKLSTTNSNLRYILDEIHKQMGYSFVYNESILSQSEPISVNIESNNIHTILKTCLSPLHLDYYIENKVVVLSRQIKVKEAKDTTESFISITGTVVGENGETLPGVSIILKNTQLGTTTDEKGMFNITLPMGKELTLEFSFVGMKSESIRVTPEVAEKSLHIILKQDSEALKEVIVTGIFNRRKEGFTGSATTIKGEEIKKLSTTDISKVLSIFDPSFRIMEDVMNGSNPNRLPDLRMRGQATLNPGGTVSTSNDIVMLQGEYSSYPNRPLIVLDGFEVGLQTMVDLDPDRIESITLLKDAAATAIYGSKAANGVIVIESLMPKDGKLWVSYGGNVRIQTPDLTSYNLMNAAEKLEAERLAGFYEDNNSIEPFEIYQEKFREVNRGVNTYWLDKPLQTAVQQRHAITMEGGDKSLRYRLYAGINLSPGIMKESKRRTMTGSLDLQYRLKKILMKNSITIEDAVGDESNWGSFSEYTKLNPYLRPYGKNGEIQKHLDRFSGSFRGSGSILTYANPMYNTTFDSKNQSKDFTVRNLFKLEYNPTDSWRLEGSFSLSKSTGNTDIFRPAQHTDFDKIMDPTLKGDYNRRQRQEFVYSLDLTASFNKMFNSIHYVTANARMSLQENQNNNYGVYVTGFPNDNMNDILFGKKYDEKMTGSEGTSRLVGWVGSFGYSYDFKYSFDLNIRVDGSSQFGSENSFAPFWSAGAKWDLKRENFLKECETISYFTLRASYGVTGTQGFAPYQSQELYSYNNLLMPYLASPGTGVEIVGMPNDKLKWQQTDTWNVGIALGLFKDRISISADLYRKITKNSLTNITLAPSSGFNTYPENLGTLENKGVEFNIAFIPYRNNAKQAYWTLSINGSHNEDKLKKISQAMKYMNEVNAQNTTSVPLPRYEEGESINRIWVVQSLGIDPATGEEIFFKRNGEMTTEWDPVDIVPFGLSEPKLQGNINSAFAYRGFGVNLSFSYKFGGEIYNATLVDKIENANLMYNADKRAMDLRWKKSGDVARYKRMNSSEAGSETKASSRFIMDENTFTMSTLSFSYRLDQATSKFLHRANISSFTLGFNMEDIFYVSSIKRERGLDYPFARQFAFTFNIGF